MANEQSYTQLPTPPKKSYNSSYQFPLLCHKVTGILTYETKLARSFLKMMKVSSFCSSTIYLFECYNPLQRILDDTFLSLNSTTTVDFYIKWHYIRTKNSVLITVDKPLSKNRLHAKVWLRVAIRVFQAIVSEPPFLPEWDFQSCANYQQALKLTEKNDHLSNKVLPLCLEKCTTFFFNRGWLLYNFLPGK